MNGPLPTTPLSIAGSGLAIIRCGGEAGAAAAPGAGANASTAGASTDAARMRMRMREAATFCRPPQADRPATMPNRTDKVTMPRRYRCVIACSTSVREMSNGLEKKDRRPPLPPRPLKRQQ